jgi:hypothetical protein
MYRISSAEKSSQIKLGAFFLSVSDNDLTVWKKMAFLELGKKIKQKNIDLESFT